MFNVNKKSIIHYLVCWGDIVKTSYMKMIPRKVFLAQGAGVHKQRIGSFELALRDAGIEGFNLVKVSSILPPHCELVSSEAGVKLLKPGQIVYCVMARNETIKSGELISASIGLAFPEDEKIHGYVCEHTACGVDSGDGADTALNLAFEMYSTKHGIEPGSKTLGIHQEARGTGQGWTTVIAVAVFIP